MPAPVEPGTVLAGKYRVDRVLGEGGMGVVVAATDTQLERRVAIKFLLPEYSQHHEAAQRFLREARAAVKIHSEHVARVIDVGTMEGGAPYMVMEYLEGKDLAGLVEERQTLPVDEAVAYVLEACDAIAEAHAVGVVHRDLKPANLFLAKQPDGSVRVKVLDFGISKAIVGVGATDPSLTRTSSMMGSPLYMSPEQMRSAKHVDPRTDVWALGVILYELLTGSPPFYAESIPELSAKVLLEEPRPIRETRPDVPEALQAAVAKALQKDPAARHTTVADLAAALVPFGPPRSRVNAERAARVLRVTTGDGAGATAAAAPGSAEGGGAYARTAAAWVDSTAGAQPPQAARGRGGVVLGAAIAVALIGVAGAVVVLSGRGAADAAPPAAGAQVTTAPAVSPPAPPPAPPEPEKAPAPTVTPEVAAAPAPSASAAAAAEPVPPVAAKPAVPARASAVTKPAPKAAAAKPAAPAAPAAADPFSGFGSRK